MKLALISTDNREAFRNYAADEPMVPPPQEALLAGMANQKGLEIHFVSCLQRRVHSPEKLGENIWFHPLQVPKIGWLRTGYQGCIRAVRKKLREIQPDIVHGQGTERDCALSSVFSGFPNVLTIHGNMRLIAKFNNARPFTFEWLAARFESFALPRTNGVLCNSLYTEHLVRPLAARTWLVANPIRSRFFDPPGAAGSRSCPLLLNIGNIEARKSQNEILEMAERLHRQGFRFELEFIGGLNEKAPYSVRFMELLSQGRSYAKYSGKMSEKELIARMDSATGFIHAPREEAFGLVVAEALARNLKLFGFKEGGVQDISAGFEGPELVDPGNFIALEQAVKKWLVAGAPKIICGKERMRERYHPSVIARRHLEIYREVLGQTVV